MGTPPASRDDHDDEPTAGTVLRWSDEDGWGVLTAPGLDGGVFAHFSMIRGRTGFRRLVPGEAVLFRWRQPGQDGCAYAATEVLAGPPDAPTGEPTGAYTSRLTITPDPGADPAGR